MKLNYGVGNIADLSIVITDVEVVDIASDYIIRLLRASLRLCNFLSKKTSPSNTK